MQKMNPSQSSDVILAHLCTFLVHKMPIVSSREWLPHSSSRVIYVYQCIMSLVRPAAAQAFASCCGNFPRATAAGRFGAGITDVGLP